MFSCCAAVLLSLYSVMEWLTGWVAVVGRTGSCEVTCCVTANGMNTTVSCCNPADTDADSSCLPAVGYPDIDFSPTRLNTSESCCPLTPTNTDTNSSVLFSSRFWVDATPQLDTDDTLTTLTTDWPHIDHDDRTYYHQLSMALMTIGRCFSCLSLSTNCIDNIVYFY